MDAKNQQDRAKMVEEEERTEQGKVVQRSKTVSGG